jgi:hypothetical protein
VKLNFIFIIICLALIFSRSDESDVGTSADYTVTGTPGCELTSNKLLCKSNGGSSGKAMYSTAISGSSRRVRANLSISGGAYNGSGSGAFVVISDAADFGSVTKMIACGIDEGRVAIRDEGAVVASDSATNIATDGTSFSVVMVVSGTSVTCSFSGSTSAEVTYTLSEEPQLDYAGLISGWYSGGSVQNFAFWDDFRVEYK